MRASTRGQGTRGGGSGIKGKGAIPVDFGKALTTLRSAIVPRNEQGQGLAEYALILALIAVVSIIAVMYFGNQVNDKLSIIGDSV